MGERCINNVERGVGRGDRLGKMGKSQFSDTLRAFSVVKHYKIVGEVKMNVRRNMSILLVWWFL